MQRYLMRYIGLDGQTHADVVDSIRIMRSGYTEGTKLEDTRMIFHGKHTYVKDKDGTPNHFRLGAESIIELSPIG